MSKHHNADHYFMTRAEIGVLRTQLTELRDWVCTELDHTITRQVAYADANDTPHRSDDPVLVFNEDASNIAYDLLGTLRAWCEHICTQRNITWPGHQRSTGYAAFIINHIIDLALTEDAQQAADEIKDVWKRTKRIIDRPQPLEFAGPCQSDLPGVACDGVYVKPGTEQKQCRGCGVTCDVQKMQLAMRSEVAERHYLAAELATAMSIVTGEKIPRERVRNWVRRNKLHPVGIDHNGDPLFRLNDALDLHERPIRRGA